jgi:hypothetical protein
MQQRDPVHNSAAGMMNVMPGKTVRGVVRGRPECANDREALYGHVGLCADGARAKSSELLRTARSSRYYPRRRVNIYEIS